MGISLADLRAQRKTDFSSITAALTKKAEGGSFAKDDEGYFKVTRDKAGNGSAVVRFLPKHPDDELPWVQVYSHGFQSESGKWMIDNCPTTIGGDCPICQANRELYKTGAESDKEIAKPRKRKLKYIANVLVVKDPSNPENDGKVMRFSFGKKIFEMIMDKIQPTFEDETPVNVFDAWEGADFKVRMHNADGYPSYAKSTWSDSKSISDDDEEILKIVNQAKALKEFIDPSKFKSFEALKKRFDDIVNGSPSSVGKADELIKQLREDAEEKVAEQKLKAPKPVEKAAPKSAPAPTEDGDDDLEAYFKDLAG